MIVKTKLLKEHIALKGMTKKTLADAIDIPVSEVEKLLSGEAVGIKTALEFIDYFGADKAQELIDWEAIGKENPLACEADMENL